jgi:hypothetical protein
MLIYYKITTYNKSQQGVEDDNDIDEDVDTK